MEKIHKPTGLSKMFWFEVGVQFQLDLYDNYAPFGGYVTTKGGNCVWVSGSCLTLRGKYNEN